MKKNFSLFLVISCAAVAVVVISAAVPAVVFAQTQATISINPNIPGVNNVSTTGPCGWIVNFYDFALLIAGILAFGAIVYGGFKAATSAGNPSKISEGRAWIWSSLLGLLLIGCAYLILYTINPNLTKCQLPALSAVNVGSSGGGTGTAGAANGGNGTTAGTGPGGSVENTNITAAALAYKGTSTAGGPGQGTVACAWAVNNVLAGAGVAPLDGDSVSAMENALTSGGRGTLVPDPSQAQPGDIVIQAGDGHVGICMNVGCTQVLSNSSSNASFSWISNTSFAPSYNGGPGRIYQLNN